MSAFLNGLAALIAALLAIVTVAPLLPVGAWIVRLCDFPRVQFAYLSLILIVILCSWNLSTRWPRNHVIISGVCAVIIVWQLFHVIHYTPLWKKELANSTDPNAQVITTTVVNLQFENDEKEAVRQQISDLDTDLLLLIEFDEPWEKALQNLESEYLYRKGIVRGEGLGIMLWSKFPFTQAEVRHLVSEKRASIFATLKIHDRLNVNYVGVHPTPPGLEESDGEGRYDSRIRDAELMLIAKIIADRQDEKWIVNGDFNDVAWSHTTRVFKRISGLLDPRVGRGLYNTYHAEHLSMRVPIDQVFLSPGAEIVELNRFRPVGSDHFAISTTFVINELEKADPKPTGNDVEDANEMINEGKNDAEENLEDRKTDHLE